MSAQILGNEQWFAAVRRRADAKRAAVRQALLPKAQPRRQTLDELLGWAPINDGGDAA